LKESQVQFQKLQFDHAIKGLENPLTLKDVRRDIARLQTEIRKRQLAGMTEDQLSKRSKIRARRRKS
jgi:large subunit ribosomal protein L29